MVIMMLSNVRKKGSSALVCPCYPMHFLIESLIGMHSTAARYTVGQYQPLVLGMVSWVQAWVSQAGGEQTTQIEFTSN